MSEKNDVTTIKSVDKALEVLEAFSEINGGINLKDGFKNRGFSHMRQGSYHLAVNDFSESLKLDSEAMARLAARPIPVSNMPPHQTGISFTRQKA